MGIGTRIGRPWRAVLLLAAGVAGGGAALAVAGVPDSNGVIHACVSVTNTGPGGSTVPSGGPNLRVIDPAANQACNTVGSPAGVPPTATELDWNQTGPQGPPGQPGQPGAPGKTATVLGGQTLTLPGGQVLTVNGNPSGVPQLVAPAGRPSGGNLTLTLDGKSYELMSLSQVVTRTGASAGAGGRRGVHELQISRQIDKASPKLAEACASGQSFKSAIIVVRKAGKAYLEYKLTGVLISSYSFIGRGGGNTTPTESLTLNASSESVLYLKH